ncbi:MAG TPA: UDP-N-acetylmuramate dehydrogenase [Ktedonobacteraceae bacterium]|nr:UDP-N-acetylmuramate dehydrogenase [Ktedonobacteraceae bacterium]
MNFETPSVYKALHPHFQERVRVNEPLALHSSFGVGGPADIWLTVETRQELSELIGLCARERWPLLVVGAGSNILLADAGVRGVVASIAFPHFSLEEQGDGTALLIAEAGATWRLLLEHLVARGWGGLEFAAGIPGTIGAGVISNVGAHKQEIGQILEWIEVLDARACNREQPETQMFPVTVLRRYQHDDLDLSYRHSRFREHRLTHIDTQRHLVFPERGLIEPAELVVTVALRVHREAPERLASLLEENSRDRKLADPEQRHLGSIFKDPPEHKARKLIEQAGLAGKRHGDAQISRQNANYIVNLGRVSAADIAALIVEVHQQVLARTGISLGLNVELLGEWEQGNGKL